VEFNGIIKNGSAWLKW